MAMPYPGSVWPPKDMAPIYEAHREWDAWYSGNVGELVNIYGGRVSQLVPARPAQHSGGLRGVLARAWYGSPRQDQVDAAAQRHVPLASDICQASGDMLFSDLPKLSLPEEADSAMAKRLAALTDEDSPVMQLLPQAAELAAALGGAFLRVSWTTERGVFLTLVDADGAVPTFSHGQLTELLVWSELERDNATVLRLIERHYLDAYGVGCIEYALFRGDDRQLGNLQDMTEHAATAALVTDSPSDYGAAVSTGTPGLAVVYVPNVLPQRSWRKHPVGRHLGRSDLDGTESLLDALDEVVSEWTAEVHRTRSRIIAAESVTVDLGAGKGKAFPLDRTVFTPFPSVPGSLKDQGKIPIEAVEFHMDVKKYSETAAELVESIIRSSGYSAATFGIGTEGAAMTATEVASRQQRTMLTRDRKIRLWRPALSQIVGKLLDVDAALFGGPGRGAHGVNVNFPDAIQPTLLDLGTTAAMIRGAQAASTETLVWLIHPDWTETQVTEELARIAAEQGATALPDPTDPTLTEGA